MPVTAEISLAAPNAAPIGRQRIRLLEAVAREGSISGAARAMGITYKAAWDAVGAMNNLFGYPLVAAQTGGRRGGGAELTEEGRRVIAAFHHLDALVARSFRELDGSLGESGITAANLIWGFFMRTSARNALRGIVVEIHDGAVNAEVVLEISGQTRISAVITRDSLRELGLFPGREATALIKAPFVILAPAGEAMRTSVGNRIEGTITRIEPGAVNDELTLDIGNGKSLTAIITQHSVAELGFAPGVSACALIDASHVILAVD